LGNWKEGTVEAVGENSRRKAEGGFAAAAKRVAMTRMRKAMEQHWTGRNLKTGKLDRTKGRGESEIGQTQLW